jgi:hypothetical protein
MTEFKRSRSGQRRLAGSVRRLSVLQLLLLLAQLLVGVWVQAYGKLPRRHPGAGASSYVSGVLKAVPWALEHGSKSVALHTGLGLLTILLGIVLVLVAIAAIRGSWFLATLIGLVGVVGGAYYGGRLLIANQAQSTLLMTAGLVVAVIGYVLAIYAARSSPD